MRPAGLVQGVMPVLLVLASMAAAGCWWNAYSANTAAEEATRLLAECQRLATRIEASRGGATLAQETQEPQDDLAQQIEAWARRAGISAASITQIVPIPPRRLGQSSYLESGATVDLRGVTLSQLAQFEQQMSAAATRVVLEAAHLTAPRGNAEAGGNAPANRLETWRAEISLTYLVYSPKSRR